MLSASEQEPSNYATSLESILEALLGPREAYFTPHPPEQPAAALEPFDLETAFEKEHLILGGPQEQMNEGLVIDEMLENARLETKEGLIKRVVALILEQTPVDHRAVEPINVSNLDALQAEFTIGSKTLMHYLEIAIGKFHERPNSSQNLGRAAQRLVIGNVEITLQGVSLLLSTNDRLVDGVSEDFRRHLLAAAAIQEITTIMEDTQQDIDKGVTLDTEKINAVQKVFEQALQKAGPSSLPTV